MELLFLHHSLKHILSFAHTQEDLDKTLEIVDLAFKNIGDKNGK